jgi:hypothetical protein
VARGSGAGLVATVFLVLAIAGCATPGTKYGQAAPGKAQSASVRPLIASLRAAGY